MASASKTKVKTFTYTFDPKSDLSQDPKTVTVEIPYIFKNHVTLVRHTESYYGTSSLSAHIDTSAFLAFLIKKAVEGSIPSTQLARAYAKYEEACKFIQESKQEEQVVLGVEQWF